jgi:hypothetical protein
VLRTDSQEVVFEEKTQQTRAPNALFLLNIKMPDEALKRQIARGSFSSMRVSCLTFGC